MVVECKCSADPTHVGRIGYEQMLPYMAERRIALAPTVASIVIGSPETVCLADRRNDGGSSHGHESRGDRA